MKTYLIIKRRTFSGRPIIPYDLISLKETQKEDESVELDIESHIFQGWSSVENILKLFPIQLPQSKLIDGYEYFIVDKYPVFDKHTNLADIPEKEFDILLKELTSRIKTDGTVIFEFLHAEDDAGAELIFRLKGYDGYER